MSLAFNTDPYGGDVQVVAGSAVIEPDPLEGEELAAYNTKYAKHITSLGMTSEQFHAHYSLVLRITPERLRGM